ncbi:MAG: ATP synthase F1 subunit delta [Candidatus Hydrogenedens sp.]|nr:ATP synthase F1 subunit delta [Candidatus Hydrogenedens sp.]
MRNYLLAERYARGLSVSLPDTDAMKLACEGLETVAELFETHHDFRRLIMNPSIPLTKRLEVVSEILDKSGIAVEEVKRLFRELLRRGRVPLLPDVAVVFSQLLDARLNQTQARVRSAAALDDAQKARVTAALEAFTGKEIHAVYSVDPRLLGGVRAEVSGVVIDGTIRSQIRRLRDAILAD